MVHRVKTEGYKAVQVSLQYMKITGLTLKLNDQSWLILSASIFINLEINMLVNIDFYSVQFEIVSYQNNVVNLCNHVVLLRMYFYLNFIFLSRVL